MAEANTKHRTALLPEPCGEHATTKASGMVEARAAKEESTRLGVVLHDLCQPLTTLQCRLEMAQMDDTRAAYRDAVNMGLTECARLVTAVHLMSRQLIALDAALVVKN